MQTISSKNLSRRISGSSATMFTMTNYTIKNKIFQHYRVKLTTILITFFFLFILPSHSNNVFAIYDPLIVLNNKFGIHIIDESDLDDAKNLVNENGDWGYVTLVIQKEDRNTVKWQKVFDKLREDHLIPIVRIATRPQGSNWEKPNPDEIDGWVSFLNSLNWVIENRYVIIGNEPNHAKEWGGEIDPVSYANYLKVFSQKLKSRSNDFFILEGALDASAKNTKGTMDEQEFLTKMVTSVPDVFENVDGWASHSYPNPDFSSPPTDEGRESLKTYQWELDLLKTLSIKKDFPIFITETGWSQKNLTEDKIGEYYQYAFSNVWSDPRIVAVTPFILNYIDDPFKDFSWKKQDGSFYKFYDIVKNFPKVKGSPTQIDKAQILIGIIPHDEIADKFFPFTLAVVNQGQAIWDTRKINITGNGIEAVPIKASAPETVTPGHIALFAGIGKVQNFAKYINNFLSIENNKKIISNKYYFNILNPEVSPSPLNQFINNIIWVLTTHLKN
ncbi:hypothetical protein HYS03_02845 [Candidatus Woesebacteria bacterium]|nr:hypothetical protein [Candidatus Woesebacteria bacterium]